MEMMFHGLDAEVAAGPQVWEVGERRERPSTR